MEYVNGIPVLAKDFNINSALKKADAAVIVREIDSVSPGLSNLAHESALIGSNAIMKLLKISGIGGNEVAKDLITILVEGSIYATLGTLIAASQGEVGSKD